MKAIVSAGMVFPSRTVDFMTFRIVQPVEQRGRTSLKVILSSSLAVSGEFELFSSVRISVRISDVRLGELKM